MSLESTLLGALSRFITNDSRIPDVTNVYHPFEGITTRYYISCWLSMGYIDIVEHQKSFTLTEEGIVVVLYHKL